MISIRSGLLLAEMTDLDILSEVFITPMIMYKTQIVSAGVHQFIYRLYDEQDCNYSQSGLPAEIERFSEHAPDLIQTYSPYLREASPEF